MIPTPQQLRGQQLTIVGLRGSGKSFLMDYLAKKDNAHLFFDTLGEHKAPYINQWIPKTYTKSERLAQEFETFLLVCRKNDQVKTVLVDEVNRLIPTRETLRPQALDMIDFVRHFDKTLIVAARRISQMHTDLTELSDWWAIFKQTGKNDLQRLDDIKKGLSEVMENRISRDAHNFILTNGESATIEKAPSSF